MLKVKSLSASPGALCISGVKLHNARSAVKNVSQWHSTWSVSDKSLGKVLKSSRCHSIALSNCNLKLIPKNNQRLKNILEWDNWCWEIISFTWEVKVNILSRINGVWFSVVGLSRRTWRKWGKNSEPWTCLWFSLEARNRPTGKLHFKLFGLISTSCILFLSWYSVVLYTPPPPSWWLDSE